MIQNMLDIALPAQASVPTLEALRVVSDSWRLRILNLLVREPLTPLQIAQRLKIARTRVYYHLDLLREHGFIRVVDERQVAAVVERTYRACARRFRVDRQLLAASASEPEVNDAQARLLERAADDLRTSPAHTEVLVARSFLRLEPAQAVELRSELTALFGRYADLDGSGCFEVALAFFATEGEQP